MENKFNKKVADHGQKEIAAFSSRIDRCVYDELKVCSVYTRRPVQDLIEEAIKAYLAKKPGMV
ncbi:MAG: ribbon-helix-helix domain-containing protein [Bacteroidales bacterium]|jgi:hypothetical protein|nr:ribbon-helix-helix domain-containing protein [Bacteroidales bacterium]